MTTISQRELRNDSGAVMRRVEAGETFVVTRNGAAVADLVPHRSAAARPPRWVPVEQVATALTDLPGWHTESWNREQRDLDDAVDDTVRDPWVPR